jgi:Ca2+-binding RTX toxin-like protein
LAGDAGIDAVFGELGADALSGGKGDDLLDGGFDSDLLMGDAGIDYCYGADGDDLFDGGAGNDFLFGDDGDDRVAAGKGNDELYGGKGKDGLFGDAGKDSLFGDDDNDHLDGGAGDDNCLGGNGNDQLKGGTGKDQVDGQAGDNLVDSDGETGKDNLANALETDIDFELAIALDGPHATNSPTIFAKIVRTLTVELINYQGFPYVDILIDGFLAGTIVIQNNRNGLLVLSTHPTGDELAFPAGFPDLGPSSQIHVRSGQMVFNQWIYNSIGQFDPAYVT